MDLSAMREQYGLAGLDESDLAPDPMAQFTRWFEAWVATEPFDANVATLATVDEDGWPAARAVLVKGVDRGGFVFHSNRRSAKGRELAANPRAALTFLWREVERQIRVVGTVEAVSDEESDEYFAGRPRGAQIGAWASEQTGELRDRGQLQEAVRTMELRYPDAVPRPPHWGGYLIRPRSMEFWQGRPDRLHDRLRYDLDEERGWCVTRLAP